MAITVGAGGSGRQATPALRHMPLTVGSVSSQTTKVIQLQVAILRLDPMLAFK